MATSPYLSMLLSCQCLVSSRKKNAKSKPAKAKLAPTRLGSKYGNLFGSDPSGSGRRIFKMYLRSCIYSIHPLVIHRMRQKKRSCSTAYSAKFSSRL